MSDPRVSLGEQLLAFLASARTDVLLAAPYMKHGAVRRVLAAVPDGVGSVTLVTRWRPEEVAAGVSDLEVMDLVSARPGAVLLLHPWLHAKLYRTQDRCLLGSANLTSKALGWATPPNLELLLEHDLGDPAVKAFEREMLDNAYAATPAIRAAIAEASAKLPPAPTADTDTLEMWLPSCPAPERLFNVYADVETFRLADASAAAGRADLIVLGVTPGLTEGAFYRVVTSTLAQMEGVRRVLDRLTGPVSDEVGMRILAEAFDPLQLPYGDAEIAWEVLKRWLLVFSGGEFRARPSGEEIVRGKVL